MDEFYRKKLEEKQRHQKDAAKETDAQFADRYAVVNNTIRMNLKDMEKSVDEKVFSGEMERNAQEQDRDYTRDYVFTDVKRSVYNANKRVYENIKEYGKAEPTVQDKKKKLDINGFFKNFTNRFVEEFKGKEANYQSALLATAREQNEFADKTTAYELSKLLNYSDSIYNVLDQNNQGGLLKKGSVFHEAAKKKLRNVPAGKKAQAKKEFFHEFRFSVAPFMKNYTTKWFFGTRYYNLDGKRLKTKAGELNPEDYNKALVEGLTLDTDADKVKDKKTLKKNREQKAAVLQRITREMLEYGAKFDPRKMTDLYVSNHIIELQEYYARLNAFQDLVTQNQWFFLGRDKVTKAKGQPMKDINDSTDPAFSELVRTHILDMRFPVANFLEAHLRAHCLQSNAPFDANRRKNYFRIEEKTPMVVLGEEENEVDSLKTGESSDFDEIASELLDVEERDDRYLAFGCEFSVVDLSKMSALDAEEYKKRLQGEKARMNSGITGQILSNKIRKVRYEQTRRASKDITHQLKGELGKLADKAKQEITVYNKDMDENNKLPEIPYATISAGDLADTVLVDLQHIREKMRSESGTVMYMSFGPEIDHIYGKMYTAVRLLAELSARRKAINAKMNFSGIRDLEKSIKTARVDKRTRTAWKREIEETRKKNIQAMKITSKNPYARFSEEYLAKERVKRAEQEYDEISKKLEYTKSQIELCRKTLRFFLTDPTGKRMEKDTDFDIIEKFLRKENLGYMFDINKLDDFDNMLDEALGDTEFDLRLEAGKDAVAEEIKVPEIKKRDRGPRARAARIHQVRRRGRLAADTTEVIKKSFLITPDTKTLFTELVLMKPEDLSKFNYKGQIPVDTEEEKQRLGKQLQILNCITEKAGWFDPKVYKDNVSMMELFENYKKARILPKDASYGRFKADIQIKIDLLWKWNNHVMGLCVNQSDKEYAYLDTDALEGMSVRSLEHFKNNLENRAKLYEEEAKTMKKQTSYKNRPAKSKEILDEKGNKLVIQGKPAGDDSVNIAYRLKMEKAYNCRTLLRLVERKIRQQKVQDSFAEFNIEAYNHEMERISKEEELVYAREMEFPSADEAFLVLKNLSKSQKVEKYKKNDLVSRINGKVKKDPDYLKKDQNVQNEAMDFMVRVREIHIGPELSDLARSIMVDNNVPTSDEAFLLFRYSDTILEMENVLTADSEHSEPAYVALKAYFEKPENKVLFNEIVNKHKLLEPFYTAVDHYFKSKGMVGASPFKVNAAFATEMEDIGDDKNLTRDEKDEKRGVLKQKYTDDSSEHMVEAEEKAEEFIKIIGKADEIMLEDPTAKLFKIVHEGGEKLDLSKANEWKKIFTTISEKGYYKTKPKKGEESDLVWMKAAARQILFLWPQSFEDFYAERSKLDTGKALEEALKKLQMNKNTAFLEDAGHAGEISAVISKKEQMLYQSLSMNKRRELDEALKHSGYDTKVFKYLFEDVEVNGAGQGADALSEQNRHINTKIADRFINRNQKWDGKGPNPKEQWENTVMNLFGEAISFKITPEMTEPAYIKRHFAYLYSKASRFAALKQIYDHEKAIFDDPKVVKRSWLTYKKLTAIKNAFGPKTRSVYSMYFEMIEAYAHMNCVDKEGRFDVGLSAAELYSDQEKPNEKLATRKKILGILKDRNDHFKRMRRRVSAELDRDVLADKVAEADETDQTFNVIEIKGNETLIRVAQKEGFFGKISDMNLLLQDPVLTGHVKQYNESLNTLTEIKQIERTLMDKYEAMVEKGEGETEEAGALLGQIVKTRKEMLPHQSKLAAAEFSIAECRALYRETYDAYNDCHKQDGSLNVREVMKDGSVREQLGKYVYFQSNVARDCARIYRELKSYFGNPKNITGKTFTAEGIVEAFKRGEMTEKLRDLRKIDLYLNLLEVDKTSFVTKDYDVMKSISGYIKALNSDHKAMKEDTPYHKSLKLQHQMQIDDIRFAQEFMQEVLKDMESGPKNPVRMIHDYVQMIFLSLKSYGVSPSGQIIEDQVTEKTGGKLSSQQIKDIAYDEADKIGDAHLELQHDVNQRLGFEEKIDAVKGGKK